MKKVREAAEREIKGKRERDRERGTELRELKGKIGRDR